METLQFYKDKINDIFIKTEYNTHISKTNEIFKNCSIIKKELINNNKPYDFYCAPNIMSNYLCDFVINESEKYADTNGWQSKRHKNYPTTDIPINEIPNLKNLINNFVKYDIFPIISDRYNVCKYFLDCHDLFVVKYDSNLKNKLEKHKDGSIFSFNILLNHTDEFEGGGTIIEENEQQHLILNTKGGLLLHSGQRFHSGNEITKGKRYILVGFINYMSFISNDALRNKNIINKFELLSYYLPIIRDSINKKSTSYLLNCDKQELNIIEMFVYELSYHHLHILNKKWDSKKYFIEFWWKYETIDNKDNIIHASHKDKDEYEFKKTKTLIHPILSTITYLTNSIHPTTIMIDNPTPKIIMSFPKEFTHLTFDGSNTHGVFNVFNDKTIQSTEIRKTLMFNIWENHKPVNVNYAEPKDFPDNINKHIFTNRKYKLISMSSRPDLRRISFQPNILNKMIRDYKNNNTEFNTIKLKSLIKNKDIHKYDMLHLTSF